MENIKTSRMMAGFSQKEVSIALKVSAPTISEWESGRKTPTLDNFKALAKLFDVSLDFLAGTHEKSPAPKEQGDITFDEFTYALHGEARDLSEEDKETLLNMARFLKQRKQQKGDDTKG